MKKLIAILMVLLVCMAKAQLDTNFTLIRFGTPAIFPYKKYTLPEQCKNVKRFELPQYSFNENQFNRIKGLLDLFVSNESEFIKLRKNISEKDSIYKAKIAVYDQMDSIQALRAQNFELAYNSLLQVNKQYNQQLVNCMELALKEGRKSKLNAGMFGVLAGLTAGVILGVALK